MTPDTSNPATNEFFTLDGSMQFSGEARINVNSSDLVFSKTNDAMTIGCYINPNLSTEKHLSFTFDPTIKTGQHLLEVDGSFRAAEFHEALSDNSGVQTSHKFQAIAGEVNFVLLGTQSNPTGYMVTAFDLALKTGTSDNVIALSGKFTATPRYIAANKH